MAAAPKARNLTRIQYRARQLHLDALSTNGQFTIIEPASDGPKVWAYRVSPEDAVAVLDQFAKDHGRDYEPITLVS